LIHEKKIVIYMNDIIIPTIDEESGLKMLREVLSIASSAGLQIKWEKAQILKRKIQFLGYTIENESIAPTEDKIRAVVNFPIPNNRKAIERFLGLTSYLRRFMKGYALTAKPLSDLLRKERKANNNRNIELDDECLLRFEELKNLLVTAPVLKLYSPRAITEVHTDASKYGFGGILMQKDSEDQLFHPVEFMSRKTTPVE